MWHLMQKTDDAFFVDGVLKNVFNKYMYFGSKSQWLSIILAVIDTVTSGIIPFNRARNH